MVIVFQFMVCHTFLISGYSIYWNQRLIKVFRADVECTNGIIHVIDHPFLEEADIFVTSGAAYLSTKTLDTILIASSVFMVIATKLFV